ncbi:hypothetical protein D3C87_1265210 [compost metagenome]
MDGSTVACRHHQRAEGRRIGALGVCLYRQALVVILQRAHGHLIVRLRDGGCDGIDAKPSCLKLRGIEANAHGIGLRAVDTHLRDTGNG